MGLGSIGRRHLANLDALAPLTPVTIWRQHGTEPSPVTAADPPRREVFTLADALESKPHFALVTGPASVHVSTAMALAAHGIHLLVEKPLSNGLEGVDELLGLCRERKVSLLVGYNYRFYEPLQAMRNAIRTDRIGKVLSVRAEVGQYLPDWRPNADYRTSVTAQRALGGGVLLELSHEIDYVRWLVGEITEVSARIGRLSNLDIDVEDTAELTLAFENGAIGSVHLDMVQRVPTRTCKVIGSKGTLEWDGRSHHVRCYTAETPAGTDLCPAQARDRNEPYLAELRHFLECVRGAATPLVPGEDGRRVLAVALAARQSALERRTVAL